MATSDDILDAAATAANRGVSSMSADGKSVSAIDPLRQLEFSDKLKEREQLAAGSAAGNPLARMFGMAGKATFRGGHQ